MSILHTMNKSPFTHTLVNSCLCLCSSGDSILLTEDGIYAATLHAPCAKALMDVMATGTSVYALGNDIEARGMRESILSDIKITDYAGFLALSTQHTSIQSWF